MSTYSANTYRNVPWWWGDSPYQKCKIFPIFRQTSSSQEEKEKQVEYHSAEL